MDEPDLYDLFVHPLHATGVRYMVVGSVASVHYGEPRFTFDVDLVVHLDEADIPKLYSAFPESDYYVPPPEVIAGEIRRAHRSHFNFIHLATGLKADFYPSQNHPYREWSWQHRRCDQVEGHPAYFAPPEYVILSKLEFYREGGSSKHLRDIRGMLAISGHDIDRSLIERAVAELSLTAEWQKALSD